jgi:hypothetical protein
VLDLTVDLDAVRIELRCNGSAHSYEGHGPAEDGTKTDE